MPYGLSNLLGAQQAQASQLNYLSRYKQACGPIGGQSACNNQAFVPQQKNKSSDNSEEILLLLEGEDE